MILGVSNSTMILISKVVELDMIKNLSNIFDTTISSWKTLGTRRMRSANQPLSYDVFIHDRQVFDQKKTHLKIVRQKLVPNYLNYLSSRGLTFKKIFSNNCKKLIFILGEVISYFNKRPELHHVMVIRKIQS